MSRDEPAPARPWHVYVVRTADDRLYTGIAIDVERRLTEHEGTSGRGAKALRGRGPMQVAYRREIGERSLTMSVESRIKRLTRREKERIVAQAPQRDELLVWLGLTAE